MQIYGNTETVGDGRATALIISGTETEHRALVDEIAEGIASGALSPDGPAAALRARLVEMYDSEPVPA